MSLTWNKSGENDWVATAPGGSQAAYDGPRFAFIDPPPGTKFDNRSALQFDLSFSHRLTLSKSGSATGSVSVETRYDRFAKWARYAVEPQAGECDFDSRVYVALDDNEAGRALMKEPEVRRLVSELFDLGVTRIQANPDGLIAKIRYAESPALDGGEKLSAITIRMDALAELWPVTAAKAPGMDSRQSNLGLVLWNVIEWVWPAAGSFDWRPPFHINRKTLALAWSGAWLLAIVFAIGPYATHVSRQIEHFARPDWFGMLALLGLITLPAAVISAQRSDAHRVAGLVLVGTILILPFSAPLRIVEVNRLSAHDTLLIPAEIEDLIETDAGSFAVVRIANQYMDWPLSEEQASLARRGRLCAIGETVEGLRGLRYVKKLRVWACRRLDDVNGQKAPVSTDR